MDTGRTPAEPIGHLLEGFGATDPSASAEVIVTSLAAALGAQTDPLGLLAYLNGIGIVVRTLDDLMLINEVADEEELSAHRVAEGVAIAVASQGEWIVFNP